jgi:hypothetical protein
MKERINTRSPLENRVDEGFQPLKVPALPHRGHPQGKYSKRSSSVRIVEVGAPTTQEGDFWH